MNIALNHIMPYVALIVVCMLFTIPVIWGIFFGKSVLGTLSQFLDNYLEKKDEQKRIDEQNAIREESNGYMPLGSPPNETELKLSYALLPVLMTLALFFYQVNKPDPDEIAMVEIENEAKVESAAPESNMADAGTSSSVMETAPVAATSSPGETIYTANCIACHQATGAGLPGAFPPLANSEWVVGEPEVVTKILLNGLVGEIEVAGVAYNGAMPAFGANLNDGELADLVTYIRSSWGNAASPVDVELVAKLRGEFGSRSNPWTAAELQP